MPVPSVKIYKTDSSQVAAASQKHKVFFAGFFDKGTPSSLTPVYSVLDFKIKFGKPTKDNIEEWFTVYNYFQYNNNEIILSRIIGEKSINSMVSYPFDDDFKRIDDYEDYINKATIRNYNFLKIVSRNPGSWGNNLSVSIFSFEEYNDNTLIYANYKGKDILQSPLLDDEFCVCVFNNAQLVEKWVITDSVESININSNYIYIIFDYKKYKYFDGNLRKYDGNIELADGNEESSKYPLFFGSSTLKLKGGYTEPPSEAQIFEEYFDVGDSNDYSFEFVIGNPRAPNAAINLADMKSQTGDNCAAFIGVPRNVNPYNFCDKLSKSNNAILYYGHKLQTNIFNNTNFWISCIGDIVGLRTYLVNNKELSSSHCKAQYGLLNTIQLNDYLNDLEVRKLYDYNINIVRMGYNGPYAFSENMLLGDKLTNRLIYNNLTKDCSNITNYYIFEQNDSITRKDLTTKIYAVCEKYVTDNNIDSFKIVCNESNNPQPDNDLVVDLYFKPKFIVEEIIITLRAAIS